MKKSINENKRRTIFLVYVGMLITGGLLGLWDLGPECHAAEQVAVDGCVYELLENHTAKVVSVGNSDEIVIPDKIIVEEEKYTVTQLADCLCYGNKVLKTLTLPDSITELPQDAFAQCTGLEQITFPQFLEQVGDRCFYLCSSLKSLSLPDSVRMVGDAAFNLCTGLEEIHLSNSLTQIGTKAFQGCYLITSIEIPPGVTSIGASAFLYCGMLEEYRIQPDAHSYSVEDGVLFNQDKTELVAYPPARAESVYRIPDGVVRISDINRGFREAIEANELLKEIYVPESVIEIQEGVSFGSDTDAVIFHGRKDSYIHQYTREYGYLFQETEGVDTGSASEASFLPDNVRAEQSDIQDVPLREEDAVSGYRKPETAKQIRLKKGKRKRVAITGLTEKSRVSFRIKNKKIAAVSSRGSIRGKRKGKTKLIISVKQNSHTYRLSTVIVVV